MTSSKDAFLPVLQNLRAHADAMRGSEPDDWQWIGPWESQRMFGITEKRAKGYAERHGGEARRMDSRPQTAS